MTTTEVVTSICYFLIAICSTFLTLKSIIPDLLRELKRKIRDKTAIIAINIMLLAAIVTISASLALAILILLHKQ